MNRPIVLIIRDGWGVSDQIEGNAVAAADTPNMDSYRANYPHTLIGTSGEDVGLTAGAQGSSEVGHLNLGAGRIVRQEVVRIDQAIKTGEFFNYPLVQQGVARCKKTGSALHLMGLVQDQGVHAMQSHLHAMLDFLAREKLDKVFIHFFADGRDTPPQSALPFLELLEAKIHETGVGVIASVMGRYWGMDRDKNWDRTCAAYDALTLGKGLKAQSAKQAIEDAYARIPKQREEYASDPNSIIETDEFIRPTLIVNDQDQPLGLIQDGDTVIHFNYRQDRAVQLAMAFADDDFSFFERKKRPDILFLGFTRYWDEFKNSLLPPMNMKNILGEVLCDQGYRELRIAETQKFRHVTSFFNSKLEEPFCMEDRILVKSSSISEDKQPEMKAPEVTALAVCAIREGILAARNKTETMDGVVLTTGKEESSPKADTHYDLIVINFANCDMVGHRGYFEPAVKAVEAVDHAVGEVVQAVLDVDGIALITSDHGNVEKMIDLDTGAPHTAHTNFDVEMFYIAKDISGVQLVDRGILSDFAPTILKLLGAEIPKEMDCPTLFAE